MESKRMLEKEVLESLNYPHSLSEIIKIFTEATESVPEAYRDSIYFDMDSYTDYDESVSSRMYMFWERPETDQEKSSRLKREKMQQEYLEKRDRAEFKRLQSKFKKENC